MPEHRSLVLEVQILWREFEYSIDGLTGNKGTTRVVNITGKLSGTLDAVLACAHNIKIRDASVLAICDNSDFVTFCCYNSTG